MTKILPILFFFACCIAQAQIPQTDSLLNSRRGSFYNYIYRISPEEALAYTKGKLPDNALGRVGKIVDSFPHQQVQYEKDLPTGHYIMLYAHENKVFSELFSVMPWEVHLLNNKTDLQVVVHDTLAKAITKAKVRLSGRNVPFNIKSQTYKINKSNQKGWLSVSYQGFTSYHEIAKDRKNARLRRVGNRILFSLPMRIVLYPFWQVRRGVLDIVGSIRDGYGQGFIRKIYNLFDEEGRLESQKRKFRQKYRPAYLNVSKPMYKPKDTLKLKAVILDNKGRPYQKPVKLTIGRYTEEKTLAILKPYNELGGYEYQFVLSDTLKLALNQQHNVQLKNIHQNKKKEYDFTSHYFKYEDYELKNNTYTFNILPTPKNYQTPVFYEKQPISFVAQGKDINGLNILDARLELWVLTKSNQATALQNVFVRDTLWHKELALDPLGETKIVLPDSILPKANFIAEVKAVFLNSNNERANSSVTFRYEAQPAPIPLVEFVLTKDSLKILPKRAQAGEQIMLLMTLGEAEQSHKRMITLPHKEKINLLASAYSVQKEKETLHFDDYQKESSLLMPYSKRDKDSLLIVVQNDRNLPFWYTIYYKNRILKRGYGTSLQYKKATKNNQNYALALQYIWQGEKKEENYKIGFDDYALKIEVKQPERIYPGQKTTIDILVKDAQDKPVVDADVTAYSYTKKFKEHSTQHIDGFVKRKKVRWFYNSFTQTKREGIEKEEQLDWFFWKDKMGLDSLKLYNLMYPATGRFDYDMDTDQITPQIAPFVTDKNGFQKIYWIDINGSPAYYERAGVGQPYSFPIRFGRNQITIRTFDKIIEIDSVWASTSKKTILSINLDIAPLFQAKNKVKILPAPTRLEGKEANRILNYLMPYTQHTRKDLSYLKQYDRYFLMEYTGQGGNFLYPIQTQGTEQWNFQYDRKPEFYSFMYEPHYIYHFPNEQSNAIKMKDFTQKLTDWNLSGKILLPQYAGVPNFRDQVITSKDIERMKEAIQKRYNYKVEYFDSDGYTSFGNATLKFVWKGDSVVRLKDLRYLVLESENKTVFKIYKPNKDICFDLPLGKYTAYWFDENGAYYAHKLHLQQTSGTTLIVLPAQPRLLPQDAQTQLIWLKLQQEIKTERKGKQEIKTTVIEFQISPNTYTHTITGQVTDEKGEPVPGVSVLIEKTTYGTVTDIEGKYSIKVPANGNLIFTSIGYKDSKVPIHGQGVANVFLEEDEMLNEVVVIGYATQERATYTGALATVSSKGINQTPIASFDQMLQGQVAGLGASSNILIRGQGSLNNGGQMLLYVIDGVIVSQEEFMKISPDDIESTQMLKDESATALYGSRGANGVIIFTTKKGERKMGELKKDVFSESTLLPQQGSSLRRNFSDEGFWQPKLRTNRAGKASFEVTFPDDITNWKTVVLAHTAHKQTGKAEGEIKSFKSLVGELAIPRFLVVGDTVNVLGKVLNYTNDTLKVKTKFTLNGAVGKTKQYDKLVHSAIDSLHLVAPLTANDSLKVQYEMETTDGYFDGELRDIPLYRQGSEEAKGQFWVLKRDTTFEIHCSPENEMILYASSSSLDWVLRESEKLRNYGYLCNEQLASKILGLLAERKIFASFQKLFKHEKLLQKHLNELAKRQRQDGQWGWWQETEPSLWISLHVLDTFAEAKQQGFTIKLDNLDRLAQRFSLELKQKKDNFHSTYLTFKILEKLNVVLTPKEIFAEWWNDKTAFEKLNLVEQFQLMHLKAKAGEKIDIDFLKKHEKPTMFGGLYFGEPQYDIWNNHVQITLLAYQILKIEGKQEGKLEQIRDFFLESKDNLAPRNTFEIASVLVIIPK
jgi:TonB-dependent SusC/RagA subfamily outer membrane receptor